MSTKINVSGVWKEPTTKINVAGVWKTPTSVKINVAGTWKEVGTVAPTTNMRADGATNSRLDNACYAGCAFYTTGTEYEYNSAGSLTLAHTWLTAGSASDVWIMWTRTGGTLSDWDSLGGGYNNVRRNVTATVAFRIVDTVSSTAGGAETITGYFRSYDAATGGNLLQTTSSATWSARRWHDACPLCCFTPDTLITMANGMKLPIKDVREGDEILVFRNGVNVAEPVDEVLVRLDRPMVALQFEDGTVIKASTDHPFHVKGVGPASVFPEIEYKDQGLPEKLEVGMVIHTENGISTLTAIRPIEFPGPVYTFSNILFYANDRLVY